MTDEQAIELAEAYRRRTGNPIVHVPNWTYSIPVDEIITVDMRDPQRTIVTRAPRVIPGS